MNYELRIRNHELGITNYELRIMKENIIQIKSYAFAVKIVKVHKHLCENKKEYVLSKQLLRSGT